MFALLALLAAVPAPASAGVAVSAVQSPIRVSLNGGDYRPGDRVSVEVATGDDGYLLVLRVDGDGRVRVLFPVDPDLDTYVRADRRYQLRPQDDDATFRADDLGGTGLVLSFLAAAPYRFDDYATGTRWDYGRLRLADPAGDAEAQLLEVVDRMTGGGSFDYDAIGYRVWGPGYESEQPVIVAGGGYDPYFDSCLACGWRAPGISIGIGGSWYDPWYDPWNNWYGWGRRYSTGWGWNGWYGWDPYWGTPWRPVTVINTPIRPTVPNPIYGTRARVPQGGFGTRPGTIGRIADQPPRVQPRPTDDGRSRRRAEPTVRPAPTPTRPAATPDRPTARPAPEASPSQPPRARSRRPNGSGLVEERATAREVTPRIESRREESRAVYRAPTVVPRREVPSAAREARSGARPASSPPPRRESAPAVRTSRPAPAARSAPPPRSAPQASPSAGRSSASPSSAGRARSRRPG